MILHLRLWILQTWVQNQKKNNLGVVFSGYNVVCLRVWQEVKDQQWKQAMDYLSAVSELNYMTQIVIMLYEDNNKVS